MKYFSFFDFKIFFEGLRYSNTIRKRFRHKRFFPLILARSFLGITLDFSKIKFDITNFLKQLGSHDTVSFFSKGGLIFTKNVLAEKSQILTDKFYRQKFSIRFFSLNVLTKNKEIYLKAKELSLKVVGFWPTLELSKIAYNSLALMIFCYKKLSKNPSRKTSRSFNIIKRTYVKKLKKKFIKIQRRR